MLAAEPGKGLLAHAACDGDRDSRSQGVGEMTQPRNRRELRTQAPVGTNA